MNKQEIKEGILFLLTQHTDEGDGLGYTFDEIRIFLKLNNVARFFEEENTDALNDLLDEMEKEELIEERHFGKVLEERIDFSIENEGIKLIQGKEDFLKNKWKILK